ncbi:RNA-directed DNA polymerase [Pseudolabrys sp. FHR47]|uniref:RNA-directed DNA polymerase n=1 Tax=Pseudolabrys sp. FHR47 TaxID=2562284 RepID=UPI0010BEA4CF|nr:RNA-directed DNA polymerase [Pseudolabrys sp. FHR47]
MADLETELLIKKGLFPENLPPVYTAANIWPILSSQSESYSIVAKSIGGLSGYNASKRGGLRRIFSVPHPVFVKDQGFFYRKHWPEIEAIFAGAVGSVSRPTFSRSGPRHVRITSHRELPKLRLKALSRFKYCLITDVARFYPSVYTHTLPWAINGKAAAKNDTHSNSATIFGNKLDFIIRQGQLKQTVGIPIGPDSSKICAEILMSAVDSHFLKVSGRSRPTYVRHVDDYWVGGDTYEDCEKHLQNLRLALKEFELDINEAKTRIVSTKTVFGESWPSEFERDIRESLMPIANKLDPVGTLGRIIERATRENDDGIIRHAIRVIDDLYLWNGQWELLEHFLAQCAVQFSHAFDYVARVVAWRVRTNQKADLLLWAEIAKATIRRSGSIGHDSEAVWALWLLKELKQKIPKALTDIVLANADSLALAFLSHFPRNGLANDRALYAKLRDVVEGDPFSGRYWPLTLELTHLSEAKPEWGALNANQSLRSLHDAKISIIDWDALPKVFEESATSQVDGNGPRYAIEDYGADYSEEDKDDGEDEGDEEQDADWLKLLLKGLPENPFPTAKRNSEQ